MNNRTLSISFSLLLLLLLDIFLVSRLEIGIYFIPHIYFLSILILPVRTKKVGLLLFGFFAGLIMDLFMNTGGIHAAASTLMAFARIFTLSFYLAPEDEDNNVIPGLFQFGYRKYLLYSSILIFLHQFSFFLFEVFKADSFYLILKKTIASTLLNGLLILFIQMLFMKPAKKNERRKH